MPAGSACQEGGENEHDTAPVHGALGRITAHHFNIVTLPFAAWPFAAWPLVTRAFVTWVFVLAPFVMAVLYRDWQADQESGTFPRLAGEIDCTIV